MLYIGLIWLAFMATMFAYQFHSSLLALVSFVLIMAMTIANTATYVWIRNNKGALYAVPKIPFLDMANIMVIRRIWPLFLTIPFTYGLAVCLENPQMLNICSYAICLYLIMYTLVIGWIYRNIKKETRESLSVKDKKR